MISKETLAKIHELLAEEMVERLERGSGVYNRTLGSLGP